MPTIVPGHDTRIPAVIGAGESIYRTIMTRIGALEMNATLYLRYVEEQTRFMREALRRLEEDLGRLEGIGKAHAQHLQRATDEWAAQRSPRGTAWPANRGIVDPPDKIPPLVLRVYS